jgi:hypothetical protein
MGVQIMHAVKINSDGANKNSPPRRESPPLGPVVNMYSSAIRIRVAGIVNQKDLINHFLTIDTFENSAIREHRR